MDTIMKRAQLFRETTAALLPEFAHLIKCDGDSQVSCGTGAAVGKAGDDACVEGLGAGTVVPDNRAKTAVNSAQSSGSESQQNCVGLGAGWGIPPAGMGHVSEDGGWIPD